MHQQSAPTWNYGAPPLAVTSRPKQQPAAASRRGRCAVCTRPILDGEDAVQVLPTTGSTPAGAPYRHKDGTCPA